MKFTFQLMIESDDQPPVHGELLIITGNRLFESIPLHFKSQYRRAKIAP